MPLPNDGLAVVIARRRKTWLPPTKPRRTDLELDWSNPLTLGLVSCVPFFEGRGTTPLDYARNTPIALDGGTPVWGAADGLLGVRTRAITDQWRIGTNGVDLVLPRDHVTVLLIRAKTDTALRNSRAFGAQVNDARNLAANVPLNTGVVNWDFGGTAAPNRLTWSGYRVTLNTEVWAFTAGPTGSAIYLNGIRRASQSTPISREEGVGVVFQLNGDSVVAGDLAHYQFFALIDAEWTEGQVLAWSRDPWQFFVRGAAPIPKTTPLLVPAAPYDDPGFSVGPGRQLTEPLQAIDWRDPMSRDLKWYTALQGIRGRPGDNLTGVVAFDLVGKARLTGAASGSGAALAASASPSKKSLGASVGFSGAGFLQGSVNPALLRGQGPVQGFTAVVKARLTANQNNRVLFTRSISNSTVDWGIEVGVGTISGQIRCQFNGTSTVNTTTNFADGKWYTIFMLWSGRSNGGAQGALFLEVYDENGRFVDRAGSIFTPEPAADVVGSGVSLGAYNQGSGVVTGDIEWAGVWYRFLPFADRFRLATEPYGHLMQPSMLGHPTRAGRLRFFFPTVVAPSIISPSGIPSDEAFGAAIVQGAILPTAVASAEAFGTHALVDAASTIAPSGIASGEVVGDGEVFGDAGAAGTIDLSGNAIATAEAFGTATLTEDATIRPTGIPSAFDMDLHTVGVGVATIAPQGIPSEEAFADVQTSALGTPISGTTVVSPTNPPRPLPGSVTNKKLCSPFNLVLAGLYTTAPNPAEILPEVYGDFTEGGLRGPIPAVLVTQTSPWIFVAAMHPVKSIDHVYVNDVEQTSGFATVPAVALGGGPQVAVIAFTDQPIGPVTWRGQGKADSTGALISDPILQLEDLLLTRGGYFSTDFDATTLAEAKAASSAAAWATAFVINDTAQIQAWITEILFNVMGFWRVSGKAQLQISLDPGGTFTEADLVDSLIAARDCIDGDDGVTFIADRQQLVNKLVANYQYSWDEGRYTAQAGGLADATPLEDPLSLSAYGEIRKEVTLRGIRSAGMLSQWADILFARQAFERRVEGAQVQFAVRGPRLIHATVGDLIAFSWPYGPTREFGNPYVNEILRIVQIEQDFTRGGKTQVIAIDTGAYIARFGVRVLEPVTL